MPLRPRLVVVHRRSEFAELVERHATVGQAEFYLRTRGRDLTQVRAAHEAAARAKDLVVAAAPADWAVAQVERADLARFLFQREDRIVVVGQDGLVANAAKYLSDQLVIGVDPARGANPGVLVRHSPARGIALMLAPEKAKVAELTMARATLDDGQELTALNDIYLGHASHQTARYDLAAPADGNGRTDGGRTDGGPGEQSGRRPGRRPTREAQASSGVVVGTGTGATGWCASLAGDRGGRALPGLTERRLAWFVREAWPSPTTGRTLTEGIIEPGAELTLTVRSDQLVVFGDGLEADRLTALWGQDVRIGLAERRLRLAV
ncbi:MAG: hypothetical protein LBG60_05485 [Bifidobacteriaceae bacterium]|nr:hypothetical protein [Bifidobacteriaceae bacterium]